MEQSKEMLANAAKQGDTYALRVLFDAVSAFIRWKAARYAAVKSERMKRAGVEFDDLLQEGYFALLDAVAAYDPARGFGFLSWLSYPLQKRWNALLGLRGGKKALNHATSLDITVPGTDDAILSDMVPDEAAEQAFDDCEHAADCERLRLELQRCMNLYLTDKERETITRRDLDGETLQGIADSWGKSLALVSSYRRRGIRKLNRDARRELLPYYDRQISTSLSSFRYRQASSVELLAELIDRERRANAERFKTELRANSEKNCFSHPSISDFQ